MILYSKIYRKDSELTMSKLLESGENYLETILLLQKRNPEVRSIDVANEMNFSKPSVSRAVGILKNGGFIEIDKNGYITLTDIGLETAERIYERHLILTEWLISIGVDSKTAAEDACKIEHDISNASFQKLKEYLKK
jgi:Mn-dependent DtxR family transcriptional regulator